MTDEGTLLPDSFGFVVVVVVAVVVAFVAVVDFSVAVVACKD
jgi:hypothetical protein